jgi:hypothetical protein
VGNLPSPVALYRRLETSTLRQNMARYSYLWFKVSNRR